MPSSQLLACFLFACVSQKKRRVYEREFFVLRFLSRCRFGEENSLPRKEIKSKRLYHIIQKSRLAAKSVSLAPPVHPPRLVPFLEPQPRANQTNMTTPVAMFFISRDSVDSRMQIFFRPVFFLSLSGTDPA